MLRFFQGLSKLLANYTSIFVIGVAVFTFFFPHTFDWVRGTTQTVILGIIMLTMGLTLTTNDFKILAQRPAGCLYRCLRPVHHHAGCGLHPGACVAS